MPDFTDPNSLTIASITMVVAFTIAAVQYLIKPLLTNVPALGRVPTAVYVAAVAIVLTYLGNRVLKTLPGDNLGLLMFRAVVSGLAASGLYKLPSALQPLQSTSQPKDSPAVGDGPVVANTPAALGATQPDPKINNVGGNALRSLLFALFALACGLALAGCQTPTASPFYNGVSAQWPPVRDTYNAYVNADPTRTPQERQILLESSRTMDALIAREGQRLRNATPPATQP